MALTRTGSYPIGFRRAWTDWQRELPKLIRFAIENDFPHLDFGPIGALDAKAVLNAGLTIASVDLQTWPELASPDAARREAAVEANERYMAEMLGLGISVFLCVIVPADPDRPRVENFEFAVEAYAKLCESIRSTDAKIVLEGAPGKPPHFASLACTPADLRAFVAGVNSPQLGVNFDPSHLVRMGIDPIRFLREFGHLVHHVHAKDVVFIEQDLYEHGNLQAATFVRPHRFGGHHWRYALPGKGAIDWREILTTLDAVGYRGRISIELEDAQYNGDEPAEKRGLVEARDFLAGV